MKDNSSIVVQKLLKRYKIPHSLDEVEIRARSHPDYPSLKGLCDTLEEHYVRTYPSKVSVEQLQEIEGYFIAHINEDDIASFALVVKYSAKEVWYYSTSRRIHKATPDDFHKRFSSIVVLLEKTEGSQNKAISKPNIDSLLKLASVISTTVALVMLLAINFDHILSSIYLSSLLTTKLIGLSLTSILVYKDWSEDQSFGAKICKSGKHVDCNSVLNSKFSNVYGWIKWSDLGFIYFLGSLSLLVLGTSFTPLLQGLSLIVLPYVLVSVYQQGYILKKWCFFCLGVLLLLIVEAVTSLTTSWQSIYLSSIAAGLFCFSIVGIVLLLLKQTIRNQNEIKEQKISYQKQKRDPEVFKALINKEQEISLSTGPYDIIVGNTSIGAITLTVFLSLTCKYCKDKFLSLKEVLNKHPEVQIHIIPIMSEKDKHQLSFMKMLYQTLKNQGGVASFHKLENWYQGKISKTLTQTQEQMDEGERIFLVTNMQHVRRNQIESFPSLYIQNKRIPESYSLTEVLNHKPELISLIPISNKKEMII